MKLIIKHSNYQVKLSLKERKKIVDTFIFDVKEDLSQSFLVYLDKFLKKCNTTIVNIKSIELEEEKSIGLTSGRIIQSIVKTLQFVQKKLS